MITEVDVKSRKWRQVKKLAATQIWTADYYCSDGDGVSLSIETDANGTDVGGLTLRCFSGIPASEIYIDALDFGSFECAPNKIEGLISSLPYETKCVMIADYICRKFCKYSPPPATLTTQTRIEQKLQRKQWVRDNALLLSNIIDTPYSTAFLRANRELLKKMYAEAPFSSTTAKYDAWRSIKSIYHKQLSEQKPSVS